MAPALPPPVDTTSSDSPSLQEEHSHERTPLLGPGRGISAISTSAELSASRLRWQDGGPRPADEEATSVSHSVSGKTDSKKLSTGIAGVISVLLLGAYSSLVGGGLGVLAHALGLRTGAFIANADVSIVLATYSTISSELGGMENASWLVVTYSLAVCSIQPTVCGVAAGNSECRPKTKH